MQASLTTGILMLAGKSYAYFLTGSAAILSDALESVIHVAAVAFAAFSFRLNARPPDKRFLYGYERISFFSAGLEGLLIILAGAVIVFAAVQKWLAGLVLERLGTGTLLVLGAAVINAALGGYLVRTGRTAGSLILEANGRHILADSWTSFGVAGGLCLVIVTGWRPFDPLLAILVGLNIVWTGGRLVERSLGGLMDYADPEKGERLRLRIQTTCAESNIEYHGLRFRDTGSRIIAEVHLLFPADMTIGEAHRLATGVEEKVAGGLDFAVEVITHLEAREDHAAVHRRSH
jgi:cation diffusion facilitator family transporter